MWPFALFVFVLLLIPDVTTWHVYVQGAGRGLWLQCLWFVPSLLALASISGLLCGVFRGGAMRVIYFVILFSAIPKILLLSLGWLVGVPVVLALLLVYLCVILYGLLFGYRHLVVRNLTFAHASLPAAFQGYRILQISDLHIGSFGAHSTFLRKLVQTVNAQHPDLIVFTGDLINTSIDEVQPYISDLSQLRAADGILSILGNHDYAVQSPGVTAREVVTEKHRLIETEQQMGWQVLLNASVPVRRGDDAIWLIGVENVGRGFISRGNLSLAMKEVPDDTYKVLLSHDPTHWHIEVLGVTDIQLTLSGHTHAGQIKIGRFSPAKWAYNEWGGSYMQQGRMLHVSCGVGGRFPFRLGAWPEINVIQLQTKQ